MNKRLPEFEDIRNMERLNGGDYLEAKNLLCYASNHTKGIMIKDLASGQERRITTDRPGEGSPKFSPKGDRLLFLAVVPGEGRQIFIYHLETEEIKQITHIRGAAMDPVWSPDGTKILFGAPISGGGQMQKQRKDEPIVIEDFGYKFDGVGYIRPDSHMHLYIVPADGGEAICLTNGQCDFLHHNWTPDGKSVICAGDKFRSREEGLGYDLLRIDVETKAIHRLTEDMWMVSYPNPLRPICTPDGTSVIAGFLNPDTPMDDEKNGYPEVYLYRVAMNGESVTRIFEPDAQCYQCVQFPYNAFSGQGMDKLQISEDEKKVYFVSGWQGQCNIYEVAIDGWHHGELVAGGKQVYHGLGRIQNEKMLVSKAEVDRPEGYYVLNLADGTFSPCLYQSVADILQEVKISEAEDFFFTTKDGESRVHGWVLPPQNRKPGEKYPTILYIHGGPHPFYTYGFTMEYQCFAAAGFGVIWCNPRGSSGYGWTHQKFVRAMDGSAYADCLQFVDEAMRRYDWIDGERMGVTGGSYGGYLTNYMAGHTKKFKAYVTQRSTANDLISYASADMQGTSKGYDSFETFMMDKLKTSTVSYAENIDKPLLILHGENDYRTPVEGAHQLYTAVKDLHPDLPVKMVIFPHTSHEQPSNPKLSAIYYREMVEWFTKYL